MELDENCICANIARRMEKGSMRGLDGARAQRKNCIHTPIGWQLQIVRKSIGHAKYTHSLTLSLSIPSIWYDEHQTIYFVVCPYVKCVRTIERECVWSAQVVNVDYKYISLSSADEENDVDLIDSVGGFVCVVCVFPALAMFISLVGHKTVDGSPLRFVVHNIISHTWGAHTPVDLIGILAPHMAGQFRRVSYSPSAKQHIYQYYMRETSINFISIIISKCSCKRHVHTNLWLPTTSNHSTRADEIDSFFFSRSCDHGNCTVSIPVAKITATETNNKRKKPNRIKYTIERNAQFDR